jgi:hypothetical protein
VNHLKNNLFSPVAAFVMIPEYASQWEKKGFIGLGFVPGSQKTLAYKLRT